MSTIASTMKTLGERESVTSISANARIDYILRFSQHAVLVIDDDPNVCSQVGNQFLGSLTKDHNAAYVALSSKLNDIQIRCRIIEQLFGNSLFDPEQPLSVNVIKLAENSTDVITIVIGSAEYMSLQLFHELCQLVEIAKKLDKPVNVLFLGNDDAGKIVSENSSLFEKKLSIILAENGQLIGLNSSRFKTKTSFNINIALKGVGLLLIITAIVFLVVTSDVLDNVIEISSKPKGSSTTLEAIATEQFVVVKKPIIKNIPIQNNNSSDLALASTTEIFKYLTESAVVNNERDTPVSISLPLTNEKIIPPKVISTVDVADDKNIIVNSKNISVSKTEGSTGVDAEPNTALNVVLDEMSLDEKYYKAFNSGAVIQLASFGNILGYNSFMTEHKNYDFKGYVRSLKGIKSHIITSKVYTSKVEAKRGIANLPQELKARGPWIKSVQAVNNEIKSYQQAQ